MSEGITDDELRELIAATRERRRETGRGSPSGPALSYDFRRPQGVSKDQTRRIESIHEQFARLFSATLSSNMRMVIDVDLAFCDQLLYNEFIASLPSPCTAYSFSLGASGGQAILSFASEVVMAVVDRALGGQGRGVAGDDRPLTQIEANLVGKLVTRVLSDLEAAWESVASVEITDVAMESNPEFIQVAAPGDGVIVVAMEANTRSASGLIHLCYPLHCLDPLLPRLAPPSGPRGTRTGLDGTSDRQRRALANTMIPVEVQVARGSLSLSDVAELKVGDVVKLDTPKDQPAVVLIGDRPKYLGRPGLRGRKRAIEILGEIGPDEEALYR